VNTLKGKEGVDGLTGAASGRKEKRSACLAGVPEGVEGGKRTAEKESRAQARMRGNRGTDIQTLCCKAKKGRDQKKRKGRKSRGLWQRGKRYPKVKTF